MHTYVIIITLYDPVVVFYYHKCTLECQICSLRIKTPATCLVTYNTGMLITVDQIACV